MEISWLHLAVRMPARGRCFIRSESAADLEFTQKARKSIDAKGKDNLHIGPGNGV